MTSSSTAVSGHSLSEAATSLLRLLVVVLFLHTFLLQPFLIPSESMERTLLVGDFLLFNKQVYAPNGPLARRILPYREVRRGDIVVFHHPQPRFLVKRVVGLPGDHLRMNEGRLEINGSFPIEPYVAFEPAAPNTVRDNFPARVYADPEIDPEWWQQMQSLTHNGELTVPANSYFVLGDNRNHSKDSRFWGFVRRDEIVARPLVIYFSVREPSSTDTQRAMDDRLGHDSALSARLTGMVRWKRIFQVVH